MTDVSEIDNAVFKLLNETYSDRMKEIHLRGVQDIEEDNVRHYAFGCMEHSGQTVGIHAYYSYDTGQMESIYESVGESI